MRHRSGVVLRAGVLTGLIVAAPVQAAPGDAGISLHVTGLRSARGQVLVCLTRNKAAFPDCSRDAHAVRRVVPAAQAAEIDLGTVLPGTWAIALLHDENGNGRADMMLMLPREGFGFSRDPALRLGPPAFARAAFAVGAAPVRQTIRMRYML